MDSCLHYSGSPVKTNKGNVIVSIFLAVPGKIFEVEELFLEDALKW